MIEILEKFFQVNILIKLKFTIDKFNEMRTHDFF